MKSAPANGATREGRPVLFITPITPSFSGNGLAMRAASLLEALNASGFRISLMILPIYERRHTPDDAEVRKLCEKYARVPKPKNGLLSRLAGYATRRTSVMSISGESDFRWRFKIKRQLGRRPEATLLFAFRLCSLSLLTDRFVTAGPLWLDLDEVDSAAIFRAAKLASEVGNQDEHAKNQRLLRVFERLESQFLGPARWISLSSEVELTRLPAASQKKAFVLPNVVRAQAARPSNNSPGEPCRLVFVASFGHTPNVDAVFYFCREILDSLQARSSRLVEFVVVGPDPRGKLASLKGRKDISIRGWVDDLAPVYADATLVVVPLRAGAGTRIKILEAFSHGRCVVSTPVGAEGLEVVSEAELVLAESGAMFAEVCAGLIADPARREAIAVRGLAFGRENHSPAVLHQALQAAVQSAVDPEFRSCDG